MLEHRRWSRLALLACLTGTSLAVLALPDRAFAADNCTVAKVFAGKWRFTTRVMQAKSPRAYGTNGYYELAFLSVPVGEDCALKATLTKTGFSATRFGPAERLVGTADATIGSGPAGGAGLVAFAVTLKNAKSALDFSFQLTATKAGLFGSWRYEGAAWKATEMGGLLIGKRGFGGPPAFPENAPYCDALLDLVGVERAGAERPAEAATCAKGLDAYFRRGNVTRAPVKPRPAGAAVSPIAADGYEDCLRARLTATPLPDDAFAAQSVPAGMLAIAPDLCGGAPGWAGIGMQLSMMGLWFSRDGSKLLACDGSCTLTDLRGKTKTVRIARSTEDVDGTPILEDPAIAKVAAELGVADAKPRWLFDDLAVSWSATQDATAIKFTLVHRATRAEVELATFKAPRGQVLYPASVQVTSDGQTLALAVHVAGDQTLAQIVKTIPVRKAAVRAFQAAAKASREHAAEYKARAAEAATAH